MADHPDGIYHYTEVNIPDVTVSFIPNANNTPVVWLVQSNVVINGTVNVSGQTVDWDTLQGGHGGPGGVQGGNGQIGAYPSSSGSGPGGGGLGGGGSFGTGGVGSGGNVYGNSFLIPLIGGSGGGGSDSVCDGNSGEAGGGGGGALLIAASGTITVDGGINVRDGDSGNRRCTGSYCCPGGGGSGGAIRLVGSRIKGTGWVDAGGGNGGFTGAYSINGGSGRVRFDALESNFGGSVNGVFTQGFQPIIIPAAGQGPQLTIASVAGVPVAASPTGVLSTPDAVLSAQQPNPVPIVVRCSSIPLSTPITVSVKPMNGSPVSAMGYNNTGTVSNSTATVLVNMPRGGGIIYATAATGN